MAFIVTESCIKCKHTDCVEVCPVDCFYEGPNFLVIHPEECIDCALCEPECPVDAIFSEDELPADQIDFIEINAELSREKLPTEWQRLKQTGITLQVFKALGCIKYDLQKRRFSWITDFYVRRSALRRDIIFEDPGSTKFHLPGLKIILANFGKVLRPFEEKNKQAGQKNFFAFGDLNLPAMDVNKRAYMKTINNWY